jgi:glycosyltransferase involved in cell wall biosynthesis
MIISVIVCTYNREYGILQTLDSIVKSYEHAGMPVSDAEIVVVDNNSTDKTKQIVQDWGKQCSYPLTLVTKKKRGLAAARNCGFRHAKGDLMLITDDDICLEKEHISTALKYDKQDETPVLRAGRVNLGNPEDLPMTILTYPYRISWHKDDLEWSHLSGGTVPGGNMVIKREILKDIGFFDERFGAGAPIPAGEESDFIYRCYNAGYKIEYVPDMEVAHYHGRKNPEIITKLMANYSIATGALYAKYLWRHPNLARKLSINTTVRSYNYAAPHDPRMKKLRYSLSHKLYYYFIGAARYYKLAFKL